MILGNLRIDLFVCCQKWVVEKPVNPSMDELRVECVANRHDKSEELQPTVFVGIPQSCKKKMR